jgi:hypothetical protein
VKEGSNRSISIVKSPKKSLLCGEKKKEKKKEMQSSRNAIVQKTWKTHWHYHVLNSALKYLPK